MFQKSVNIFSRRNTNKNNLHSPSVGLLWKHKRNWEAILYV
jgi:hypothetical protein